MSGPPTSALTIPEPLDEDDDDIRWALQTAAVQWRRGAREDAIAWLRRGADAAVDGGLWERASQLNVIASQLERSLSGDAESDAPAPPSAPKFPPRAPSPASHSVAPHSTRLGLPAAPISVRAPTSTPAAPNSKWPTGFPTSAQATSTPSGRAIAPPPPLPASVRVPKAPIPPRPKSIATRDSNRLSVEIHGVEELDMSEAELVELQEDVTVRAQITSIATKSVRPEPKLTAPGSFKVFPSYEPDEDPMDGTTTLPLPSVYPASFPPDSLDGGALPAFPLEDSVPAGPPSVAPEAQTALRSSPLPQISVARLSSGLPGPVSPLQAASGHQKFSRPSARVEPKDSVRPAAPVGRTMSPGTIDPIASDRPPPTSRKPQSLPPVAPSVPLPYFSEPPPLFSDSESPPPFPDTDSLPTISMEDLEEVSDGSAFAREEPETSVIPPTPSVPGASIADEAETSHPPSARDLLRPTGAPLSSDFPLRPSEFPATLSKPARSEPASAASLPPDRETPIPSSGGSLQGISIRGINLSDVRGLCDLPEDAHRLLRQRARIERMGTGEDLSFFSVVLVLEGWVKLMPAIADVTCATAAAGEVVFTQGTLEDGVALRVVAGQNGTALATWDRQTFDSITESCPWVADELRLIADSFQALAGTALGMLGERLDDALREVVTSRCQVLTLLPHEVLVAAGKTVPGMHIVGAGLIELVDSAGSVISTVAPGDFLLTDQVLAGGVAPHTVRAAASGALVLFAPRMIAHELLVSVPPLLEILAG